MDDNYKPTGTAADCPFYRGVGDCDRSLGMNCSAFMEPRCITEEPLEGWSAPDPVSKHN